MMEWYLGLSYFLTNSIRAFVGLYLVCSLLSPGKDVRRFGRLSAASAAVTVLQICGVSDAGAIGAEILLLSAVSHRLLSREQTRMSLFLLFFYEIAAALWEFLISCAYAMAFRAGYLARWHVSHQAMDVPVLPDSRLWLQFLDSSAPEHLPAVWTVRLCMLVLLISAARKRRCEGADIVSGDDASGSQGREGTEVFRTASVIAVAGMICVVTLGSQTVIPIPEDQLELWNLLSVILLFAVLVYNLNRHYEAEKEIARLKEEQAELLERDYQSLNRLYSEHARLFHDLHNHIELLQRYLVRGNVNQAVQYLEDLQRPVREMTGAAWTGDEAVDYLIGNKLAAAEDRQIAAEVRVEFPRHTNIRSADLTAILGNLLDNALEAAKAAEGERRFLRLAVRRINHMLVIKVENGYSGQPVSRNGELLTTKTEGGLHGWGLKSVRAAAEKYDGAVETTYEENVFRVVVTLSFEAVKRDKGR